MWNNCIRTKVNNNKKCYKTQQRKKTRPKMQNKNLKIESFDERIDKLKYVKKKAVSNNKRKIYSLRITSPNWNKHERKGLQ